MFDNKESIVFIVIIVVCLVFIGICLLKRRPDMIINFGLRACIGTLGVYLLDIIFKSQGFGVNVGINGVTILTNGLLGFPGFLMLYGLAAYYNFK